MKLFFCLISLMSLFGCSSCSLDQKYFNPRKTDAYTLSSTIPHEEVSFTSNGNTIYGVFSKAAAATSETTTIMYIHGDDKDIDKFWPRIEYLYPLGVNVFIYDFQGYGKSTGEPSLADIKKNTEDAFAYLKTRSDVNPEKIVFYAFSLGGIFALHLSANGKAPAAIITEAIPASTEAAVRAAIRMAVPASFLFDETFNNVENVKKTSVPLLMFHGTNDETLPYKYHAEELFAAAKEPKTTITVSGAGHSDLITVFGLDNYRASIQEFLRKNNL